MVFLHGRNAEARAIGMEPRARRQCLAQRCQGGVGAIGEDLIAGLRSERLDHSEQPGRCGGQKPSKIWFAPRRFDEYGGGRGKCHGDRTVRRREHIGAERHVSARRRRHARHQARELALARSCLEAAVERQLYSGAR
jgi:hypothetical protein